MTTNARQAIQESAMLLRKIYGERLNKVLLYGSYARGEQWEESDIDFLVVLNEEKISSFKELEFISDNLFELNLKYNIPLSFHPISKERLKSEKSFFLNNVRKEGVEL